MGCSAPATSSSFRLFKKILIKALLSVVRKIESVYDSSFICILWNRLRFFIFIQFILEGAASEEDQVLFSQYPVNERDWVGAVEGISSCSKRLVEAVRSIEDNVDVRPFAAPVSLVEYPDYLWDVDYPIDLSTIVERVENRFYRFRLRFF